MINVGMIGAGYIAEAAHCPALAELRKRSGNSCLKAICNRTASKAIHLKEKFGFEKVYTDYREMLEKEDLDCVYVLTAVDVIKEHALAVMSKGIPLLMEKPPGRNPQETRELIAAARKCRISNFVAFNRRFDPLLRKGKELFRQRNEISHIAVEFYRWNRTEADFYTTAIHGIDAIRFLAGDI